MEGGVPPCGYGNNGRNGTNPNPISRQMTSSSSRITTFHEQLGRDIDAVKDRGGLGRRLKVQLGKMRAKLLIDLQLLNDQFIN